MADISNNSIKKAAPLKRHPALIPLSRDHHFGLLLCWKIRTGMSRSISPDRMARYTCYFFDHHLATHFHEEEKFLFNLLEKKNEKRKEAERQHRKLRRLRLKLEEIPARQAVTLGQIEKELEAHIRFEERDLFPYLQQQLTKEQLAGIFTQLQESHQQIAERWDDPFWEKNR